MLRNNLMLPTEALDIPEAIDFDGTNDYLSRASDLTGNADGKTFTFSAWIYLTSASHRIYDTSNSGTNTLGIWFVISSQGFAARAWNASGTYILFAQSNPSGVLIPVRTWTHILFSVDLTNTSNRHFYVNDVLQPITWTTYTNDTIDFTRSAHGVGAYSDGAGKSLQSISHLYLDYTYRNLSVEANRRLFITADRKPAANQQALNPILYLPLNDPTQPGKNLGTGGDFNLTGVVARSGRGPNQYNAPYSDLDGSADYLSRAGITGIADGKQLTLSCIINTDALATSGIFYCSNSTGTILFLNIDSAGRLQVVAYNIDQSVTMLNVRTNASIVIGRNYNVVVSVDVSNTGKRHFSVNGEFVSVTWNAYSDTTIPFSSINSAHAGLSSRYFNGRLGNVFFDTKYIDLSNPDNLAKFVTGTGIDAKPADLGANGELPFGTPPLIYLPMYGNNAGKNYGTGGNFTVNSGPFTGARGPNEYWGNKADFNGTTGYLARTSALAGVSDGKTFSASFSFSTDIIDYTLGIFGIDITAGGDRFLIYMENTELLRFVGRNSAGTIVFDATTPASSIVAGAHYYVQICIDLTNTAKRFVYFNGSLVTMTWTTYTNSSIAFSEANPYIGAFSAGGSGKLNGKLSEFYFTTDYIDFSQEANRLKFRDAFGNPVALQPQIEAGTLPNPAIYMRFDPANFGKNSGTGGDFTVNGIITDGGQL